jgi:glycosyltransferase involved in cell wall biosynthesis
MRIAFVSPEYVTEQAFDGGLANHLHRVACGLVEMGHEPIIVVASDRDESLVDHGIRVERVATRSGPLDRWGWKFLRGFWPAVSNARQSWKLCRRLERLHREEAIDVVQFASYTATGLFRTRAIPAVVRLSSIQALWDASYELERRGSLAAALNHKIETLALRRADALVSPSRILAEVAQKLTGREVEVIQSPYVRPNCVFDPTEYERVLEGKCYALFFGTVGLLKGVLTIAGTLERLLAAHPDLHFVFVGKQTEYRGRPMMEHVLERAGPHRDRILHLDRMRHESLYPVIQGAEVVVLPSRVDNLPNACLEAMALGKVVVGTRGASFDELIDDGETGYLCEIDDPESLLAAVEKALGLEDKSEMGAGAARRIDRLDPAHVCEELLAVYRGVQTPR